MIFEQASTNNIAKNTTQSTMNVKVGQPNYMYVDIYTELCVQNTIEN
jgi:hypothetical protein